MLIAPGRRIPIVNVEGHGPADPAAEPYPFCLEPEVAANGWAANKFLKLPNWCVANGQHEVAIWMPHGNHNMPESAPGRGDSTIAWDTWQRARQANMPISNRFALENFVGNMNSDGDCKPMFYVPPLPRAGTMPLEDWLRLCEMGLLSPFVGMAGNGHRFSLCLDTLGAAGKPGDPGRWYVYALVESLIRQGIRVGIEPPGEHDTLWHEFPSLFGWVTPEYLIGHENQPRGWLDGRWHPSAGRDIYINQTPAYAQHTARWLAEGYHILTPTHVWSDSMNATEADE